MMTNIDVKIRNPYNNCILRKIIYHQYLPMLIDILDPLGTKTDRLRCEVCQNLILSPMNTGPLRPAVATAPTVYGIETLLCFPEPSEGLDKLQQHLPFTVLKRCFNNLQHFKFVFCRLQQSLPFTVCAAECEAAEERSDDEAHTLQVPERREGKTKVMRR